MELPIAGSDDPDVEIKNIDCDFMYCEIQNVRHKFKRLEMINAISVMAATLEAYERATAGNGDRKKRS